LEAVATWPARALAGRTSLAARPVAPPVSARPPAGWRLRAAAVRNLGHRVAAGVTEERWTVGVVDAPAERLLRGMPHDRVRWLDPPAGGFIADPMALPDDGDGGSSPPTLLAEAYWFGERRGKIVALDAVAGAERRAAPEVVVDRPWHLSYPHLFRHDGETYCLPEQWQARRVQLLRAERFPDRWVDGPVLLDGYAGVDATLHHDGQRFWLFCADEDDLPNARLSLFHSEELERGWRPHPWNPVRCDLRNTRPAGPLFRADGALWRPAQDCTETYGGAVVLNRVVELTPDRFREEPGVRLAPDPAGPYPDGLHTFCPAGPVTLVDGKRHFVAPGRLVTRARAVWRRRRRAERASRSPGEPA
jgi:hypothetical protein